MTEHISSPPGKIAVLLADVDGTLVTEQKVLTERAIKAVRALKTAGITFAVTSGRPPKGMAMLIEPLALETPIAGFNGGAIVKPDGEVIEEKTLPPVVARAAIKLIEEHKMDAWLYTASEWFVHDRKAPHCDREAWTVKFEPKVVETFADTDLDKAVKIVGVSDDHDLVAKCESDAQAAFGDKVSAARSQPYYLDVTHPHANKGDVVEVLSKMLGISKDQFATIGDMPNDVLMFKKSGFSIAMGNASDAVKQQASATTASYNDEGFAKAIEDYLLKSGAA
ncbi:Cof-type HAD-IIB family hydrolase [Lichenifustis flavocetrariae]|uniref:HAD family hydrolase n=1 Tax=Lichenifustis flavocetrariae TaxID=2949735 RepID=A0AA42CMT0_9HYPH|nr:Cof-type HAD-IIB family hydrolase [Lichenifustis flavocetrariae]MCW6508702.1 HAD family hydrolase [Lichenifustis flavocetrariae]